MKPRLSIILGSIVSSRTTPQLASGDVEIAINPVIDLSKLRFSCVYALSILIPK